MNVDTEQAELTEEEARAKAAESNQRHNNDRLKRMEAIADSSEDARPEGLEPNEDEQAARALQAEGVEEAADDLSDERVVNGVKHYLTVVNGVQRWMTLEQLRTSASKVEAADEYLRTASEAARNSARAALSKPDEPAGLEEDEARRLLAAAALGDEEAISRLARVITAKPSGVTPDVLQALDQRLSFRTELAQLEAEQKDLLEDPYMGRLFRVRLNELKQENPNMTLSQAYRGIGQELRKAFPGAQGSAQKKLERKRTLPSVPQAAQRQSAEGEEEGEEDPSAVIERMAKARGLTAHLHRRQ